MSAVYIIAEAGVNHNGDLKLAYELIDVAVESGADAVKFQTFKSENLVTATADKAGYQKQSTNESESQFDMLKRLELSYEDYFDLLEYCNKSNIEFLSTAFDFESLAFLAEKLGLKKLKISSGDITNGPLLLAYASTGADIILSTGLSTLAEVEDALAVLSFGILNHNNSDINVSNEAIYSAYCSQEGQKLLKEKVTLLHCTTEYPAPFNEINLKVMQTMRAAFGLDVGYSDHSEGIVIPIMSATLGASIIEKHFTLDKKMAGPDHNASLNPDELKEMVKSVRIVEKSMGSSIKHPTAAELKNCAVVRKSLVAACDIRSGDIFCEENVAIKRVGKGRSPMEYWNVIGERSPIDFKKDEAI